MYWINNKAIVARIYPFQKPRMFVADSILFLHGACFALLGFSILLFPHILESSLLSATLPALADLKPASLAQVTVFNGVLAKLGTLLIGEAAVALVLIRMSRGRKALGLLMLSVRCALSVFALDRGGALDYKNQSVRIIQICPSSRTYLHRPCQITCSRDPISFVGKISNALAFKSNT